MQLQASLYLLSGASSTILFPPVKLSLQHAYVIFSNEQDPELNAWQEQ